jgi:ssDNA-binding Zn-finger/Zn-ribbon topoisomerase 1
MFASEPEPSFGSTRFNSAAAMPYQCRHNTCTLPQSEGSDNFVKATGKCTKCEASGVIRIPGQIGAFGSGNNIPVGKTIFSSAKVSRYVCGHCGYSEEWVESTDLQKLREKYTS